jgi:hypothetical protein
LQCRGGSRWSEGRKLRRGEITAAEVEADEGNTTAGADEEEDEDEDEEEEEAV